MSIPEPHLETVRDLLDRAGIPWASVALVAGVGSAAHGMSAPGSDSDYIAIRTESLRELVGPPDPKSKMLRTACCDEPSGPGDIDLTVHTVRRFLSLAAGGNPTVLEALFSPASLNAGMPVDRVAGLVASKQAYNAFSGYMDRQIVHGKNAEHDVLRKKAAHAYRIGSQGIEYLSTGRITIPMPDPGLRTLRGIREGRIGADESWAVCESLRGPLERARDMSPLPDRPDRGAILDFLEEWHLDAWAWDRAGTRV